MAGNGYSSGPWTITILMPKNRPSYSVSVMPASEEDVVQTVKFCHERDISFAAVSLVAAERSGGELMGGAAIGASLRDDVDAPSPRWNLDRYARPFQE